MSNPIAPLERIHMWQFLDSVGEFHHDVVEDWYRRHGEDAIGGIRAEFHYNMDNDRGTLRFEIVDFDRDVPFGAWRTGTVSVWFDATGQAESADWSADSLYDSEPHTNLRLRPLWLSGRFWHLVDDDVKAADSDWTDDPFFGAADVNPRRKGR